MATVAKEWTANALAIELNLDRKTVMKRLAGLEPVRVSGTYRYCLMRDVFKHFAGSDTKFDAQEEQAKLNAVRREKVEVETRILKGELCRTEEFKALWTNKVTYTKTNLLGLTRRAAPQVLECKTHSEVEDVLKGIVYEALDELSGNGIARES